MKKMILVLALFSVLPFLNADEDFFLVIDKFSAEKSENIVISNNGLTLVSGQSEGVFLSNPVQADIPFNAAIVTWLDNKAEKICVNIRASVDGTNWTEWSHVSKKESDLLWKDGTYRLFQYKIKID